MQECKLLSDSGAIGNGIRHHSLVGCEEFSRHLREWFEELLEAIKTSPSNRKRLVTR